MKLKVKDVSLSTGGPLIVILNEIDATRLDLYALDRINIKNNSKKITAVVNITENIKQIAPGQIGLFEEVQKKLNTKNGTIVDVAIEPRPNSIQYIKDKLDGNKLSAQQMNEIVKDILENNLSEIELAYFVSGCYSHDLDLNESLYLIKAITSRSKQLKLNKRIIADKHCIGGIPGNRTTMVVIPIIAAAGITIPKTSSRSITSPSGTADTMEVLAPVSLSLSQIKQVIKKTNACIVWGGALDLAAADDKLIKLERPLSLDPEGLLLASILSKKKAVNATHALIDIPVGEEAKIKTKNDAIKLKNKFIMLGKKLGIKIHVEITDGSQPVGNGIGPVLEAIDVLNVLRGAGPIDLRKKSIRLANILLKMVNSKKDATTLIDSGLAYEKFKQIVEAQGGTLIRLKPAPNTYKLKAKRSGRVKDISNKAIASLARIAGAPTDKGAGVYLHVHKNDKIQKNDILLTIYSENSKKLEYAINALREKEPIKY